MRVVVYILVFHTKGEGTEKKARAVDIQTNRGEKDDDILKECAVERDGQMESVRERARKVGGESAKEIRERDGERQERERARETLKGGERNGARKAERRGERDIEQEREGG